MPTSSVLSLRTFFIFLSYLSTTLAADQGALTPTRKGYKQGDLLPVSCLNRSLTSGEHITDAHGNLQYIPFPSCNETQSPLSFPYATPETRNCTIDELPDELYHLIEFFVHSDVPLTCRVPTYPLEADTTAVLNTDDKTGKSERWTPFTIALQGTLQLSHMHLHTNINVLFHTDIEDEAAHLIGSTAYSLPNTTDLAAPKEGTKIIRNEPLVLTFNVGWIDGAVLPGMAGRPVSRIADHRVGFSLLSFFACAASAGLGAMGMLVWERRRSGRSGIAYGNGLLGGNNGNGAARTTGYGGYGGYSSSGKRD